MIDIHCHILNGVDDGSMSEAESLVMAESASDGGTRAIVATSHYFNEYQCEKLLSKKEIKEKFRDLKRYFERVKAPVNLYLGSEQYGVNNIYSLIENDELITINDSKYLLIEFSLDDEIERAKYVISQFEDTGIIPVIAHPERYEFVQDDITNVFWFLRKNCLLQVNKGSIIGRFGAEAEHTAMRILRERVAHAVASDAHGPYQRTANLSEAFERVCFELGDSYADYLFYDTPDRIVHNKYIERY